MSFLAALTDTVLLCSYPSRTAAERNNPLISFLCLSLPPLHLCNVSHLCTDSVSTLPSFWRPLFPSCLVPHLALVWYFSLLTYLVYLISLHSFFFFKQILLCCPQCNKSIQKHKYGMICTATWCCWCTEPTSVMLTGTAWLVIPFLLFLSASSCLLLHFNCNLFSTGTFLLLFAWLVFSTVVNKISSC